MSASNGLLPTDHIANLFAQALLRMHEKQSSFEQELALFHALQAVHDEVTFEALETPVDQKRSHREIAAAREKFEHLPWLWAKVDQFVRGGLRSEGQVAALLCALQLFKQNRLTAIRITDNSATMAEMDRLIVDVVTDPRLRAWCDKHGLMHLGEVLLLRGRTGKEVLALRAIAARHNLSPERLDEWIPPYARDPRVIGLWMRCSETAWNHQPFTAPPPFGRGYSPTWIIERFMGTRSSEHLRFEQCRLKTQFPGLHAGMYIPKTIRETCRGELVNLHTIGHQMESRFLADFLGVSQGSWYHDTLAERSAELQKRLLRMKRSGKPDAIIELITKFIEEGGSRLDMDNKKVWKAWPSVNQTLLLGDIHLETDRELLMSAPSIFGQAVEVIEYLLGVLGLKLGMSEQEVDAFYQID